MSQQGWGKVTWKQGFLAIAVIVMTILHQSELLGIAGSTTLVFGWLPAQLAYDAAFNLLGFVILAIFYQIAPEYSEEADLLTRGADTSGETAAAGGGGE